MNKIAFLSLSAALALSAVADAQCTVVPGSGCPGAGTIVCGAQPTIGQPVRFVCPPSLGAAGPLFFVLGSCFPVPQPSVPFACAATCTSAIIPPFFAVLTTGVPVIVNVPNNTGLQGLQFCIQCAQFDPSRNCIFLSQASSFVVM